MRILFTPKWGANNFKLNTIYATPTGYVSFITFDMYMSHIRLVKMDNSEIEVDSAALFIYTDNPITEGLNPVIGNYKAIKFSIGLDSIQNRIDPSMVPDGTPVFSNSTLWWPNAGLNHLFIQLYGYQGSTTSLGGLCAYNIGRDSMYRSVTITRSFSISEGQSTSLVLDADLQKIFNGPNAINVLTQPYTQSVDSSELVLTRAFANDFSQIFSIQ